MGGGIRGMVSGPLQGTVFGEKAGIGYLFPASVYICALASAISFEELVRI